MSSGAADSENIATFMAITGTSDGDARKYLDKYPDVQNAVSMYFAEQAGEGPEDDEMDVQEEQVAGSGVSTPASAPTGSTGGAYTLSGQPVGALPSGWGGTTGSSSGPTVGRVGQSSSGSAKKGKPSGSRFATLGSLSNSEANSVDEDDEAKRQAELYAGGQGGSGMAIQGPGPDGKKMPGQDIVEDILKQARDAGAAAQEAITGSAPKKTSFFGGGGNTLGSDDAPSVAVPDRKASPHPSSSRAPANRSRGMMAALGFGGGDVEQSSENEEEEEEEVQIRTLTFWKDGFSIQDGPLMRHDDPHNKEILEAIKSGRAPLALLNVKYGQPVELRVALRTAEPYQAPPPKPMQAFEGSGQRLGAPAPKVVQGSTTTAITNMPASFATAARELSPGPTNPAFEVDPSKPVTTVQVRLADGTKQSVKLNLTHTVGELRSLLTAAQPGSRAFILQTTFPTKVLEDGSQTIEAAGLKNAVVVQRWA